MEQRGLRRRSARLAAAWVLAVAGGLGPAAAEDCERAQFQAVVDEAAGSLRDLNQKNKPAFQSKLKQLMDKRGWSQDQFLKEAAPLVNDPHITQFDDRSAELLAKIQTMGSEGGATPHNACATLEELRGHMRALVGVQTEKWNYMFAGVERELAK